MSLFTPQRQPLILRPYQREAVDALYRYLREHDDNPCVVLPTAAGKTPVMATICSDAVSLWSGRVMILAHVRELLEQARDKLDQVAPDLHVGVHSAGLKRRDTAHPVIIAGIQSVYQKAEQLGRFDLILIDEAHMIPPGADGDGMYRRFIDAARQINPDLRIVGLTATPFRMQSGPICLPPPDGILNAVCYEIGVRELIRDGYLSPLRSKAGRHKANMDELHVRAGEFVAEEVETLMDQDGLVQSACAEIVAQANSGGRKAVLIFASGVKHGRHVAQVIEKLAGAECGFIDGQTPDLHRDSLIRRFRAGELRYLCNVNVLTTGFDAPNVDCVALLRPTMSPGLYYQMIGRGFRLHPGKTDCLVLDFGGNVLRHGPVDQVQVAAPQADGSARAAPAKECPQCQALIATGYASCPECGHVFPPPERRQHDASASGAGLLSGDVTQTKHPVRAVSYSVHVKRDAPPEAPRSMRVEYQIGFYEYKSEWICLEHPEGSYPRTKAQEWWRRRSNAPLPESIEQAVALAEAGALAATQSITVRSVAGEKFDRIVDHELAEKPYWPDEPCADALAALDEQPDEFDPASTEEIPF